MLPLPVLPQNTWYRTLKKSVFVLVLILFFCSSLVAATGLQVQTQAPVNKTVATAETTPVKLRYYNSGTGADSRKDNGFGTGADCSEDCNHGAGLCHGNEDDHSCPGTDICQRPVNVWHGIPDPPPGKDPDITDCPANFSDSA